MKIIVSHDVDHLYWTDHLVDTYFYGLLYRSLTALGKDGISIKDFTKRFSTNQLTHAIDLNEFNKKAGIPSTFFFGMRKGLNLSYSWKQAGALIKKLHQNGACIGLHGMAYNDIESLSEERDRILQFLPAGYPLGIRNHYLRKNADTLHIMNRLGFLYDSTHYEVSHPSKVGNMWEIPISFMDAGNIKQGRNNLQSIQARTLTLLRKAEEDKLPFFVLNFHDTYFTPAFSFHYDWYRWLIDYLRNEQYEFTSFIDAVGYLNEKGIEK